MLLAELRAYEPADDIEDAHRSAIAALVSSAADPFARHHFEPGHITASCFIVDSRGRLLLHQHRRLGRWLQMGGHVEPDETPIAAALREGAEESGLRDLELAAPSFLDLDVHSIPAGRGEPDHRHFDIRYLATTASADAIAIDEEESASLAWTDLDRAVELMNEPGSTRAIRKIKGIRR
jgi:8-oxo-dGTP pyrophosphatase MutT (NUDIX family)